jgi:ABC-2 type transport system permease protein
VRRELRESRSLYIVPLAVAGLSLFGFLIRTIHLRERMRAALALDAMGRQEFIEQPFAMVALMIMASSFLVAVFYCLDALHGERRDRSILFWKSLPVSDLITVLSKASIPIVVLPLICVAVTVATQWIMLLLSTLVLLGNGRSIEALWTNLPLFRMSMMLLFHLLAIHGIWYAPIYSWLLLVSGWARRAVFLWAVLPPLAFCIIEKVAFNTTHFAKMLGSRFMGGSSGGPSTKATGAGAMLGDLLMPMSVPDFLASPGLWIGLAIAAVFLAAAVQLRRSQGPI